MTVSYYGADIGARFPVDVLEALSTTGKNIELALTVEQIPSKEDAILALEAIKLFIVQDDFPPI